MRSEKSLPERRRLIVLLAGILALNWLVLAWFVWHSYSDYRDSKTTRVTVLRIEELRGIIIHLDEVLTMSARMAAVTADLRWESRYHEFEPALDAAIKEVVGLAPDAQDAEAASRTDQANQRLVAMEKRAFDLIRQGRADQAGPLLFSREYEEQKAVYAQGMTELAAGLSRAVETGLTRQQHTALLHLAVVAVLLPTAVTSWLVVFRATRNWSAAWVAQSNKLAEANRTLDQKVAERTKELARANERLKVEVNGHTRAAEAAHASEEQFRITLASIGDAVVAADMEGRITRLNRAAESLTGWTSEEAKGRLVLEILVLVNEGTGAPAGDPVEEALRTGQTVGMADHTVLIARDGTERPIADSAAPIRDASGRVVGAVTVFRDITEERRRQREKDKLMHDIGERAKELQCLYELSRLTQRRDVPLHELLAAATEMLPQAVQHPTIASARVRYGDHTYDAGEPGWDENAPRLAADIQVHGQPVGWVAVCYRTADRAAPGDLFLMEEKALVDAVATHLGQTVERKQAEDEVTELQERVNFVLGATNTGLDIIDSCFNIRYINATWQRVYGDPAGRKCHEYFMGRSDACPGCGIVKALESKEMTVTEEFLPKENNRPIQVTTMPFQNAAGEWLVAEVNVDISERKRIEQTLRDSECKYRALFEGTSDAVMLLLDEQGFLECNQAALEVFGCTRREDLIGKHPADFSPPTQPDGQDSRSAAVRRIAEAMAEGGACFEWLHWRKDRTEFPAEVLLTRIDLPRRTILQAVVRDVTERKRLERELVHLAAHDPLTGLLNRRRFDESLRKAIPRVRRGVPSALILMDVDGFKSINDALGHAGGDEALVKVASLLRGLLREEDTCARVGGDEFAVLLEGANLDVAQEVAERICRGIRSLRVDPSRDLKITLSVGVVEVSGVEEPGRQFVRADAAMYAAKEQGRDRVVATPPCGPHR